MNAVRSSCIGVALACLVATAHACKAGATKVLVQVRVEATTSAAAAVHKH